MNLTHNRYFNFSELTSTLQDFEKKYPDLCKVTSLGKTEGGFDIWLMTLTKDVQKSPDAKPGFWVDGNTHATELAGCQACVHLIDSLLSRHQEPQIQDLLQHVTFYIVPRISVEGAELAVTNNKYVRSSPEIFPAHVPQENFLEKDLDGD